MAAQARSKEEIIARLNALQADDSGNTEEAHREAASLLTDALLLAGMSDVVDAYQDAKNRIGFWFA